MLKAKLRGDNIDENLSQKPVPSLPFQLNFTTQAHLLQWAQQYWQRCRRTASAATQGSMEELRCPREPLFGPMASNLLASCY